MVTIADIATHARATRCKVCDQAAELYGVADFNKSCEEQHGKYLPRSGIPIYYHRCKSCGLVFTESFDHWQKEDYLKHIYNDEYIAVDPDYVEARPHQHSALLREFLIRMPQARHLDYGGGNGKLSELLTSSGYSSSTWDPMDATAIVPEMNQYDLVTAFEVFEHTPVPRETMEEILGYCEPTSPIVLFSTYTIDALPPYAVSFWYISPRNGHITIHTETSLKVLFRQYGMQVHHFGNGFHLAHRGLPDWIDLTVFHRMHIRGRFGRGVRKLKRILTRSTHDTIRPKIPS